MSRPRRVALAREALPSVTAWVELLISSEDDARRMASDAVVAAASASGITTVTDLARAARDHIARRLAGGDAAIPAAPPTEKQETTTPDDASSPAVASAPDVTPQPTDSSSPYLPGHTAHHHASPVDEEGQRIAEPSVELPRQAPARRTPAENLAEALVALRPHERLAAVRFYLDGESVDSIATLFRVERAEAVSLLESVTAILAPIVGEHDLPDFDASTDATEIEVVTR
jgi:hypothetical protein